MSIRPSSSRSLGTSPASPKVATPIAKAPCPAPTQKQDTPVCSPEKKKPRTVPVKPTQKLQLRTPPPPTPSPAKHKSVTPQTVKASAVKSTPPARKAPTPLEYTPAKPELSALNQKAQALRARVGPTPKSKAQLKGDSPTIPQTPKTDLDSDVDGEELTKEEEKCLREEAEQTSAPLDPPELEKPKRPKTAAASKIVPPIHVNEEATWL